MKCDKRCYGCNRADCTESMRDVLLRVMYQNNEGEKDSKITDYLSLRANLVKTIRHI